MLIRMWKHFRAMSWRRRQSPGAPGWRWFEDLAVDARVGTRMLMKSPAFTGTTLTTLALAIGATTAIFGILNGVLLRPLPFADPDRLVQVYEIQQSGGPGAVNGADLAAFRASQSFDRFTGYEVTTRHLPTARGVERLTAVVSDLDFFAVLGVRPSVGRTFGPADTTEVAVLSDRLWGAHFDRRPSIVGETIDLEANVWDPTQRRSVLRRTPYRVVGVMPANFQFPYAAGSSFAAALPESRTDVWVASPLRPTGGRVAKVTARMKRGVLVDAAQTELAAIERGLDVAFPGPYRPTGVQLEPLADIVRGPVRAALWLLFGSVSLVLIVAAANVANLLLARLTARSGEIATRAALGAGRLRLGRQFLAESLVLSLAGGSAGLVIAFWALNALKRLGAASIPRVHELELDWDAVVFLCLLSIAVAIALAVLPLAVAGTHRRASLVPRPGRGVTTTRGYRRMRNVLVVGEVALAFVLTCGAALLAREAVRLQSTDIGMTTANVVTLHLTPPLSDRQQYYAIEQRVTQLPGVVAAGFTQMVPLQNWGWVGTFRLRAAAETPQLPNAELRTVTPGYFTALGIPLRAGRPMTEVPRPGAPQEVVVNETLARRHFGGHTAVGQELDRGRIVGIVGDVPQQGLDRPVLPEIYQSLGSAGGIASDIGLVLVVRTDRAPDTIIASIRSAIRSTNPRLAVADVKSLEQIVADSQWELTLHRWLIGVFALLALVLALVGIYGVIAYNVTDRLPEFAVRIALGADPVRLARLVLDQGATLAVVGLVSGGAILYALAPALRSVRTGFSPDIASVAAVSAALLGVALGAAAIPAYRAARVNPASALRHS